MMKQNIPVRFVVHQMGKVGSTSVVHTFQALFPEEHVYQTHMLQESSLAGLISQWLRHPRRSQVKPVRNLIQSIELSRCLEGGPGNCEWYLFSLIREPLGRNVSAFFENLERQWFDHIPVDLRADCLKLMRSKNGQSGVPIDRCGRLVKHLLELFQSAYPHHLFDDWFSREVERVFGIDVLAEPFDREKGYHVYTRGSVRMVLVRLEELDRVFDESFRSWLAGSPLERQLPAEKLTLARANDGAIKGYADLYRLFRERFLVPQGMLTKQYTSRVARHFYTDEELTRFASRWQVAAE